MISRVGTPLPCRWLTWPLVRKAAAHPTTIQSPPFNSPTTSIKQELATALQHLDELEKYLILQYPFEDQIERTSEAIDAAETLVAGLEKARDSMIESEYAEARQRKDDERKAKEAEREARKGIPEAVDGIMGGVNDKARGNPATQNVIAATAALKDGASSDELAGLDKALEGFVATFAGMNSAKKGEIAKLSRRIDNLAEQIRKNRN